MDFKLTLNSLTLLILCTGIYAVDKSMVQFAALIWLINNKEAL